MGEALCKQAAMRALLRVPGDAARKRSAPQRAAVYGAATRRRCRRGLLRCERAAGS